MKLSRYNIYDEEKFSYIANTLTGSLIQVTKEEMLSIKRGEFERFDKNELDVLKGTGILIDFALDEVQLLRNTYNFCNYTNQKTTVTIVPSLKCNFECIYCYEKKSSQFMNEKIQEQAVLFLQSLLMRNHISELNVCWYGGEPLLYMDIIRKMSVKIIDFCNEKGIRYHASVLTNGYLINRKIVDVLKQCSIERVQITIDGMEETHNIRRKLIDGRGTYARVKNAVFLLADNNVYVAVRVNLDKSNICQYQDVHSIFSKHKNVVCYPAIVTIEETQSLCQKELCYGHMEFEEFYGKVYENMQDYEEFGQIIQPGICNCAAEHLYSYIIAPDGNLYKCLNDICDSNYAVGHVSGEISKAAPMAKYLGRDPFTEPECKDCPYIPICCGGCVYEYKKHNTHACKAVKFMYQKYCQKKGGKHDEGD